MRRCRTTGRRLYFIGIPCTRLHRPTDQQRPAEWKGWWRQQRRRPRGFAGRTVGPRAAGGWGWERVHGTFVCARLFPVPSRKRKTGRVCFEGIPGVYIYMYVYTTGRVEGRKSGRGKRAGGGGERCWVRRATAATAGGRRSFGGARGFWQFPVCPFPILF